MSKTLLAITAAVILTVVPAVLQGRFTNRWGEPPNLNLAGEGLQNFPRELGTWKNSVDEPPLSEAVCRELGLVNHFHRQYVHAESGGRVVLLLMVGPSGKLVRHPPDICYTNRANQQIGEVEPLPISQESKRHEFKLLHFRRVQSPLNDHFLVAYGFATESGLWSTPSLPRMAFGAAPVLYKLQVLAEVPENGGHEPLEDFLNQLAEGFPRVLAGLPGEVP